MLPPGRARPATIPAPIGSPADITSVWCQWLCARPGWPGYPRARSRPPEDSPARTLAQEIARRSLPQNDTRRDESFLRHSRGRAARPAIPPAVARTRSRNTDFPKAAGRLRKRSARPRNDRAADKFNKLTPPELTKLHLIIPAMIAVGEVYRIAADQS